MEVAVVTDRAVDVGELVVDRLGRSYRLARAILLDDREAEDAVQEASLAAWRRQGSLRDPARFDAWFERILVNVCRDQLRRRSRSVKLAPPPIDIEASNPPIDDDVDHDLDRALAALDMNHRLVVVMRYWQDRTVDDIAARLGIPSGTVKSRLHNALQSMRAHLESNHGRP